MKKVKMMLLSLALLAVVGGAVAFNVKNGSTQKICTHALVNNACAIGAATSCPDFAQSKTVAVNGNFVCTTTFQTITVGPLPAQSFTACATNTEDWQNGHYGTTTLDCGAASTRVVAD